MDGLAQVLYLIKARSLSTSRGADIAYALQSASVQLGDVLCDAAVFQTVLAHAAAENHSELLYYLKEAAKALLSRPNAASDMSVDLDDVQRLSSATSVMVQQRSESVETAITITQNNINRAQKPLRCLALQQAAERLKTARAAIADVSLCYKLLTHVTQDTNVYELETIVNRARALRGADVIQNELNSETFNTVVRETACKSLVEAYATEQRDDVYKAVANIIGQQELQLSDEIDIQLQKNITQYTEKFGIRVKIEFERVIECNKGINQFCTTFASYLLLIGEQNATIAIDQLHFAVQLELENIAIMETFEAENGSKLCFKKETQDSVLLNVKSNNDPLVRQTLELNETPAPASDDSCHNSQTSILGWLIINLYQCLLQLAEKLVKNSMVLCVVEQYLVEVQKLAILALYTSSLSTNNVDHIRNRSSSIQCIDTIIESLSEYPNPTPDFYNLNNVLETTYCFNEMIVSLFKMEKTYQVQQKHESIYVGQKFIQLCSQYTIYQLRKLKLFDQFQLLKKITSLNATSRLPDIFEAPVFQFVNQCQNTLQGNNITAQQIVRKQYIALYNRKVMQCCIYLKVLDNQVLESSIRVIKQCQYHFSKVGINWDSQQVISLLSFRFVRSDTILKYYTELNECQSIKESYFLAFWTGVKVELDDVIQK